MELPLRRVSATASRGSRIDRITASVARQRGARPPLLVAPPPVLVSKPSVRRWSAGGLQLLVKGQGYGHGVGMRQWGAHGLAEQGAQFARFFGTTTAVLGSFPISRTLTHRWR